MAKDIAEEVLGDLNNPVLQALLRKLTFEFRKGEVTVYGPGEIVTSEFSLMRPDKAGNSLLMKVPGEDETEEVTIERDRLILREDDGPKVFKRISGEEFEKRREQLEAGDAGPAGGAPAVLTMKSGTDRITAEDLLDAMPPAAETSSK